MYEQLAVLLAIVNVMYLLKKEVNTDLFVIRIHIFNSC